MTVKVSYTWRSAAERSPCFARKILTASASLQLLRPWPFSLRTYVAKENFSNIEVRLKEDLEMVHGHHHYCNRFWWLVVWVGGDDINPADADDTRSVFQQGTNESKNILTAWYIEYCNTDWVKVLLIRHCQLGFSKGVKHLKHVLRK